MIFRMMIFLISGILGVQAMKSLERYRNVSDLNSGLEPIGESSKAECTSVRNTEIEELTNNQHNSPFQAIKKLERLKHIVNFNESGKDKHIAIDIMETEGLGNQHNPLDSQEENLSIYHGSSSTAPPIQNPNDLIDAVEKRRLLHPECDMDNFYRVPGIALPRQVRSNGCIEWAQKDPASCCISHTIAGASLVCFVLLAAMAVTKTVFRY